MSSIWVSTRGTQDQPRPMVFSAFGSTLKSSLIASTDGLIMRIGTDSIYFPGANYLLCSLRVDGERFCF